MPEVGKKKTVFNIVAIDSLGGGIENVFLDYSQIIQKFQDTEKNVNLICIISSNFCHLSKLKNLGIKTEILNIKGHFDILAAIKLHFLVKKYKVNSIIGHNGRVFATINIWRNIFFIKKKIELIAVSHGGSIKRILQFDKIIAVANHIANNLRNSNFKGQVTTIYNGYKIKEVIIDENLRKNFTFGCLSRLSKEKNIDLAIESFSQFYQKVDKNSFLIIAGDGNERSNLELLVKKHNLENKIKFLGWIDDSKDFFSQIDLFLQPALKEPFGITILESFNYKIPVIACKNYGPEEIIDDDFNGYLFTKDKKDSLFFKMKQAYLDQENFVNITRNAKKILEEKFSFEIMEMNLIKFLFYR